ncbi:hypothetical protein Tco_1033892 [Tanacetum coccineum]
MTSLSLHSSGIFALVKIFPHFCLADPRVVAFGMWQSARAYTLFVSLRKGLKRQKEAKTVKNQQETGKSQRGKSKSEKSARDHSRISPTQSKTEIKKVKSQITSQRAISDKFAKIRRRGERIVGFKRAQSRGESRVERNTEGGRPLEEAPRGNGGQSVNLRPLLAAHLGRGENGQPLQSSPTCAYGGQALPNNIGGNLPSNALKLPHANSTVKLPYGENSYHLSQEGNTPQTFANSNMPSQNGFTYPANMPTNSYPFYTHPMYTFPNVPAYTNPNLPGAVLNPVGLVTPFLCWIEDYPLLNGLKMPSHISSYDGKGDPDNFLHLFERDI